MNLEMTSDKGRLLRMFAERRPVISATTPPTRFESLDTTTLSTSSKASAAFVSPAASTPEAPVCRFARLEEPSRVPLVLSSLRWLPLRSVPQCGDRRLSLDAAFGLKLTGREDSFGLPTVYQAHFWLSKQGSNSVRFLSMAQAT